MNPKILLAFAGGLIVASGITYIAMKRNAPVAVDSAHSIVPSSSVAPSATPSTADTAPVVSEPVPAPAASAPTESAKPSPAVSRTRPATKAKSAAAIPAPAPANSASAPATEPPPPAQEQARVEPPAPRYEPPPPPLPPQPHTVTVPTGTLLTVRLGETLSTERNQSGDQFTAALDQPLVVDGFVIAERGARAQGRIVELERSGKVRGVAKLAIELTQLSTADGQKIRLNTAAFTRQADTTKNKDAAKVGIGAALGAAIGAIAGGGKGAGIGAGVGGAAGAGDVLMTRGQAAELRVETRVSFRLSEAVTITEKLH